jgi:hypothetical protein
MKAPLILCRRLLLLLLLLLLLHFSKLCFEPLGEIIVQVVIVPVLRGW